MLVWIVLFRITLLSATLIVVIFFEKHMYYITRARQNKFEHSGIHSTHELLNGF